MLLLRSFIGISLLTPGKNYLLNWNLLYFHNILKTKKKQRFLNTIFFSLSIPDFSPINHIYRFHINTTGTIYQCGMVGKILVIHFSCIQMVSSIFPESYGHYLPSTPYTPHNHPILEYISLNVPKTFLNGSINEKYIGRVDQNA